MILNRLPLPDRLASIQINTHRVEQGQDGDERESPCGDEGGGCGFLAEVEEGGSDSADVD